MDGLGGSWDLGSLRPTSTTPFLPPTQLFRGDLGGVGTGGYLEAVQIGCDPFVE